MTMSESDSDESDEEGSSISLSEGLSPEALAALFKFVVKSDENEDEELTHSTTEAMSERIGESLDQTKPDPARVLTQLEASEVCDAVEVLKVNGCKIKWNLVPRVVCQVLC
jgi:hypothetical protein